MIHISIVDDRKCRIRERQTDAEVMSLIDYPESGFSTFTPVSQVIFPETPGDGVGQTPALDFRLAGRHACSGGELAVVMAFGKKSEQEERIFGWDKKDGEIYYYEYDRMIQDECREIDGEWYYFHEDGHMARDEFVHYRNHTYYLDKKGHMQDDDDVFQKKDKTYYINDFKFTGTGSKRRENEALAEEMMFYHQQYHKCIEESPYVTQGSILACTNGTKLTRLDARTAVDIRDIVTGLPVLGCDACKTDENIHSFYGCRALETSDMPMREVIAGGYKKCIPTFYDGWTLDHDAPIIWNSVNGDHTVTLIRDSVIVCRFGGMIGVVEIPEEAQTAGEIVLITNDSVNIRNAAGGSTIVAVLKSEVLITDLSDQPVQAVDSEGNTLDWIRVRYFNQKDEGHPENWEWIDGWAAKKFTYECPKNPPGKNELHCIDDYIPQAQMLTNARYVRRKLLEAGWSKNAVYAILGNMETESHINPLLRERTNTGGIGKGFGLVHWTPKSKLTDWTTLEGLDPNDIDTQLKRIIYEIDTVIDDDKQWNSTGHNSGITFKEFTQSTESVEKLAEIFLYCYEQPTDKPQPARGKQARKWHDILELLDD